MNERGCLMAKVSIENWSSIVDKIPRAILYNEDGYGRKYEPHITILYGFLPSVNANTVKRLISSRDIPKLEAWVTDISLFENDAYNVLKMGVFSPPLHYLNQICRVLPYENDYPEYKPHMTLAYLLGGYGYNYAKDFDVPGEVKITGLLFSDAQGGKTEISLS